MYCDAGSAGRDGEHGDVSVNGKINVGDDMIGNDEMNFTSRIERESVENKNM